MDTIVPVITSKNSGTDFNEHGRLRTDSITKNELNDGRELRSTDVLEPTLNNRHSLSGEFDVQSVYNAFVAALRESQNPNSPIGTQDYINGYRELLKFFDQLGFVFKFVKDDVVEKLTILQKFVDNDINAQSFDTIQNAIDYETDNNLIKTNKDNFTRTLLRLHRALIFIEEFLRGLTERPSSESTASIATHAYDSTLYNHHGFLIRTTVKVGFRALPSRKDLDGILFHGQRSTMIDQFSIFIKTIKHIYDSIQNYYTEKNYLQLP